VLVLIGATEDGTKEVGVDPTLVSPAAIRTLPSTAILTITDSIILIAFQTQRFR
jgi:hypothetical protein